jgi:hypothetical protein
VSIRRLFVDEGIIVPEAARKPSPPCDVGRVLELDDAGRAAAAREIAAVAAGADPDARHHRDRLKQAAMVQRLRGR